MNRALEADQVLSLRGWVAFSQVVLQDDFDDHVLGAPEADLADLSHAFVTTNDEDLNHAQFLGVSIEEDDIQLAGRPLRR
jgi:hypothetical protein